MQMIKAGSQCHLARKAECLLPDQPGQDPESQRWKQQVPLVDDCVCFCRRVRVFAVRTGKLTRIYDESLEAANELQRGDAEMFKLEPIDFGRRMAQERELQAADPPLATSAVFDESGNFLIYPTLLGIKAGSHPANILLVSLTAFPEDKASTIL